jgi:hypothetical protein
METEWNTDIFVSGIDKVTQVLTEGSITSANLVGPLQGKQLSDLIALMRNGQAYVNVHTE